MKRLVTLGVLRQQCLDAEIRHKMLQSLLDLTEYFVPAVFTIGWMVRECFWVHRHRGTGVHARRTLEYVYSVLLQLQKSEEHRSEYVRSVGAALLSWTAWHDDTAACLYVEESNEAALSRLAGECRRCNRAVTVKDVSQLYVNCGPPKAGARAPSHHNVSARLVHEVQTNVRLLLTTHVDDLAWTPWRQAKTLTSVRGWPRTVPTFPSASTQIDGSNVTSTLRRTVQMLRHGRELQPEVTDWLNQHVPRNFDIVDDVDASLPSPVRGRRRRLRPARADMNLSDAPLRTVCDEALPSQRIPAVTTLQPTDVAGERFVGIPTDPNA